MVRAPKISLPIFLLSYQILMNVKTMISIIAETSWIVKTQMVVIFATSENLNRRWSL